MARNKILIITDGFFPGQNYGGPPVSVNNFCSLMSDYDIFIVTRDHDLNSRERYKNIIEGWNKRENCSVIYLKDIDYSYNSFKEIINDIKPDFIYLQSLFQRCVISCLYLAKKNNIKAVLAPRGELCSGAFHKKYKKIPYIWFLRVFGLIKNAYFQSTLKEESININKYLGINPDKIFLLTNIPSCSNCKFPKRIKNSGTADFVYLSRIHQIKNLKFAIRLFNRIKDNVNFDIYGPIEDVSYWNECKSEIDKLPVNINVKYCGLVSHDDIHRTLNNYDALVLPTHSENFGHVIAESLYSECPVIISDQTPWNDIPDYNAGFVVPLDNEEGFVKAIQSIINSDDDEMRINAKNYITKKYNLDSLHDAYKELFS